MNGQRKVVFALALVFLAGFGLGRLSGGTGESFSIDTPQPEVHLAEVPDPVSGPSPTPEATPIVAESVTAPGDRNTWLDALSDDPRAALAKLVFDQGGDPQQAVDFVIDRMSDGELISVMAGVTNFTQEDLSTLRDPREFARRLSSIAMDGLFREQPFVEAAQELVSFSTAVTSENAAVGESLDIEAGARRVYAVFPSEGYPLDEVVVKWYRTDNPEILLLGRYPIVRGDAQSFVWLERRHGWPAGAYGVEFYTSDDRLEKFASGQYVVQ